MMQKRTNLSDRSGRRCDICIGCGRCVDTNREYHVLTGAFSEKAPVWNGVKQPLIAVDIGTTTIAMQLYGKDGSLLDTYVQVNPQTLFGADVLSRIQAAENPQSARVMQQQVRKTLAQGIGQFREKLHSEEVPQMVIAANTTMVYLLQGWNPAELGQAPFWASHLEASTIEIDGVKGYVFPGVSAFVGGDIVAGILASGMREREELTLLLDLGTNGELVLGNRDRMIASATAAGPAFEGGVNRGVWGADMVSILAELRRKKKLDETGLLEEPYFSKGIRIGDVCVTQESVRAVQLAKAAIRAGIRVLLESYGVTVREVKRVILAGGLGYYLKPKDAVEIGLLPPELLEKTVAGGNLALAGAVRYGMDCSLKMCDAAEAVLAHEGMEIINLAENDGFQDAYISYINFPE